MADVRYDPAAIYAAANLLYSRAWKVQVFSTIGGGIGGFIAGALLGAQFDLVLLTGAAVAFFGLTIGLYMGEQRSFMFKLQAQVALCQAEIERNTRSHRQG